MKREYIFYIYIVSNYNRNVLYTGFTNNLVRRIIEHQNGYGSVFTIKYNVKYLMYYEVFEYSNNAIYREKEIKGWKRERKIDLIKRDNADFIDLSEQVFKEYCINDFEIKQYLEDIKKGELSTSVIDPSFRTAHSG